ncbi:DNA-binding protein [Bacteroidales bacterium OttesenSCG-928-M06]|nr:DNA-binding protein [Bacteroidales bacterium OttesenSCG-928-M06]
MKFVVQARKNPQNRDAEALFYPQAKTLGSVDLDTICNEIALSSSLTRGDVTNTIMSFLDTVPKYLKMGFSVKLGELGSFRLSINSIGSSVPEEANASKVRNIRPVFIASTKLKKEISDTQVEVFPTV